MKSNFLQNLKSYWLFLFISTLILAIFVAIPAVLDIQDKFGEITVYPDNTGQLIWYIVFKAYAISFFLFVVYFIAFSNKCARTVSIYLIIITLILQFTPLLARTYTLMLFSMGLTGANITLFILMTIVLIASLLSSFIYIKSSIKMANVDKKFKSRETSLRSRYESDDQNHYKGLY
ncbi:hypothetical protein GE118_03780 [Mycoplasma sp. NEAQ87857]|uniref:hypothetical protein n=1 Tax=Mycoplasma sp. NEAQ87857 TaxID=2683967 RepID=UPI001315EB15|nr:hypothetical protein [Mycoplasma sp. NEAQ87857]QGZ97903.1 hypothetical protein GE118_03780 [Mycoplasma sp. NEAQ87857]